MKKARSRGTSANATLKKPSRLNQRSIGDQIRTSPDSTAITRARARMVRVPGSGI
jgi:hypothetical protein